MVTEVPRGLVEELLLGPPGARRQLQDSPILADVWFAFAREPDGHFDLLITPDKSTRANKVAVALVESIESEDKRQISSDDEPDGIDPNIASLSGIVAATLCFWDILRCVVPMTQWWHSPRVKEEFEGYTDPERGPNTLSRTLKAILAAARDWNRRQAMTEQELREHHEALVGLSALDRYIALTGLLLWAGSAKPRRNPDEPRDVVPFDEAVSRVNQEEIADHLFSIFKILKEEPQRVFQVSCNRTASAAVARSVPAVKADAARNLFSVECRNLTWAVVDSGIDATHPAFLDRNKKTRVRRSFDFTQFRRIVSLSNDNKAIRKRNLSKLAESRNRDLCDAADDILLELAKDARKGQPVNWRLAEQLFDLGDAEPPANDHGTHVAGIIGANAKALENNKLPPGDCVDGMCPDINLYDLRVLAPTLSDTEFAVIAALQFIRHLNESKRHIVIHGVNLSLSIPHNVRNYACGRTPVCLECEKLVESGVVVAAAAGNRGYQSFETKDGSYEGYAALSLTDPGNADGVITVGATHRYSPHTYGVSFFSSRGPTGDGRLKPDLVAPGERIHAPIPDGQMDDLDGTSMAAPHVSGAAAMLMARYTELIGKPRRIKQILCDSATDLGRERNFQGRGMLDVLRAFQSV